MNVQNASKFDENLPTVPKRTKILINAEQAIYRRDTEKYFRISVNCFHNVPSLSSHKQLCLKLLSLRDASPIVRR